MKCTVVAFSCSVSECRIRCAGIFYFVVCRGVVGLLIPSAVQPNSSVCGGCAQKDANKALEIFKMTVLQDPRILAPSWELHHSTDGNAGPFNAIDLYNRFLGKSKRHIVVL